jgi:hypothetical protein
MCALQRSLVDDDLEASRKFVRRLEREWGHRIRPWPASGGFSCYAAALAGTKPQNPSVMRLTRSMPSTGRAWRGHAPGRPRPSHRPSLRGRRARPRPTLVLRIHCGESRRRVLQVPGRHDRGHQRHLYQDAAASMRHYVAGVRRHCHVRGGAVKTRWVT